MANALSTPSLIVERSAAILRNYAIAYRALRSGYLAQTDFKLGDGLTMKIRLPAAATAETFPGAYSSEDHQDSTVSATMFRVNTKKKSFSVEERRMEIADFTKQVIEPNMAALGDQISNIVYAAALVGMPYAVGTAGALPSTVAHYMAPQAMLSRNKSIKMNRRAVLGPNVANAMFGIDGFTRLDARGGDALILNGDLGSAGGVTFHEDQTVDDNVHAEGTYDDGTALTVNAAALQGATSFAITGGAATGTIVAGDLIRIAGITYPDGTLYTFVATALATAVAGVVTVNVYPALPAALAGGEVVTILGGAAGAKYRKNIYCDEGFMAAVVMPTEWQNDAYSTNIYHPDGYGVTFKEFAPSSTDGKREYVFEAFVAAKVVRPEMGCILLS